MCARCLHLGHTGGFSADVREDSVTGVAKFMLERELTGLRYSQEEAGPIIETFRLAHAFARSRR
jgi:hypothetical protein